MSYIGFIPKTILQNLDLGQVFNQNPVLKLLHQQPKGITIMKYQGQGKKEYIIKKFDDYANEWVIYSKPVTIGQASWIVNDRPHVQYKIEKIEEVKHSWTKIKLG